VLTVPGTTYEPFGAKIFTALGDYWTKLYTDARLIERISEGNGLAAAQTYLEFVETVMCLDRKEMPAYHRELYIPIVIKLSERNTGQTLKIGQKPKVSVGPQTGSSLYQQGAIFTVGGPAPLKDTIPYPIHSIKFDKGIDAIHNKLFVPTSTLVSSQDFYVENNTLFIRKGLDPFESPNYPVRTVVNSNGEEDKEILLWGTNALVDQDFVYNSYGYALGRFDKNPEVYLNQLNALWDLQFVGTDIQVVKQAAAALVNVPCVKEPSEQIEVVTTGQDGQLYVVTDHHSYLVERPDTLLPHIVPGGVLYKGDYLTDAVKVYWNLDTQRFVYPANDKITLDSFLAEVPSLYLPKAVIGNYTADTGVILTWEQVPVTYEGLDDNGNWKIKFNLKTNAGKESLLWQEIWERAERDNVDLAQVFSSFITQPAGNIGSTIGSINPMQYYMDNFLKANATVVTVNFNSLPASITSLRALTRLKSVVPAHTLLITLGRLTVSELPYDLTTSGSDVVNTYDAFKVFDEANVHGSVSTATNLTYRDSNIQTKWIRRCI